MAFKVKDLIVKIESSEGPIVVFCEGVSCEGFTGCNPPSGCHAQSACHAQSGCEGQSGCAHFTKGCQITACTETRTRDFLEDSKIDALRKALEEALKLV
jgi:hypothetical protein